MNAAAVPALHVLDWSALLHEPLQDEPRPFGSVVDLSVVPAALRRRMGAFERAVARCVLGVAGDEPQLQVTLGSRFGNLQTATGLLRSLAVDDLLSPMGFALSVHNAAAGLVHQIRGDISTHSAIAAGEDNLGYALLDILLRLSDAPDSRHVAVIADLEPPAILDGLDPGGERGLVLALKLAAGTDSAVAREERPLAMGDGRGMLSRLQAGDRLLRLQGAQGFAAS